MLVHFSMIKKCFDKVLRSYFKYNEYLTLQVLVTLCTLYLKNCSALCPALYEHDLEAYESFFCWTVAFWKALKN